MRFFKLHDDEICAVVDASGDLKVVLILVGVGLGHLFGDGKHPIELEEYSWGYFRDAICKGCDQFNINETLHEFDEHYLCKECPKEVKPQ